MKKKKETPSIIDVMKVVNHISELKRCKCGWHVYCIGHFEEHIAEEHKNLN